MKTGLSSSYEFSKTQDYPYFIGLNSVKSALKDDKKQNNTYDKWYREGFLGAEIELIFYIMKDFIGVSSLEIHSENYSR